MITFFFLWAVTQTQHRVNINGADIAYTAEVGMMPLIDEATGDKTADIFYIAYTRDDVRNQADRPITFTFNGGPGSSSVWLHMGTFGPRRVLMEEDGNPLPPPAKLVDNEESILDVTDLVFIDPVSTGLSRAADPKKASEFHNVEADAISVGAFIRNYLSRNGRWSSPKFVAGESYGTVRAAALTDHLQARHGVYLNGVMLISAALDYQTGDLYPGNDLPYPLYLPSFAATAWYHRQLDEAHQSLTLPELIDKAEAFATDDYYRALLLGDLLASVKKDDLAKQLAALTGLDVDLIKRHNLRISPNLFGNRLLQDQNRVTGRLDSRIIGPPNNDDPSYNAIQGPYTGAINHYLRTELKLDNDDTYEVLAAVWQTWTWQENDYINVSENLKRALTQNPALKVFVGSGYYDFATPYFATEYTLNHLGLEPSQQKRISTAYYESGHMMYIHRPSLSKLKADLVAFMNSAIAP